MITDSQTNFLYLADTLPKKYPDFYNRIEKVLKGFEIEFGLLPDTKDIWAVDYMPVQIAQNIFVRFTYNPQYLQTPRYLATISDTDDICRKLNIKTIKSDIVLDGGNVIRGNGKVIMTERVFKENPSFTKNQLDKALREILQVDTLIFIPEQPYDFTGHADGLVRFLNDHTLIINDFGDQENKRFLQTFRSAISKSGLETVSIPYWPYDNTHLDQARGCYINFLQMENTIVLPVFGIKQDEIAVRTFENLFPRHTITTIESNEIADEGGILNCITWNIRV